MKETLGTIGRSYVQVISWYSLICVCVKSNIMSPIHKKGKTTFSASVNKTYFYGNFEMFQVITGQEMTPSC